VAVAYVCCDTLTGIRTPLSRTSLAPELASGSCIASLHARSSRSIAAAAAVLGVGRDFILGLGVSNKAIAGARRHLGVPARRGTGQGGTRAAPAVRPARRAWAGVVVERPRGVCGTNPHRWAPRPEASDCRRLWGWTTAQPGATGRTYAPASPSTGSQSTGIALCGASYPSRHTRAHRPQHGSLGFRKRSATTPTRRDTATCSMPPPSAWERASWRGAARSVPRSWRRTSRWAYGHCSPAAGTVG
jgi:hypothetical protein